MSVARLARSAAALALAVAGLAVPVTAASVLTAGPAAAATCGGGPGVTVVVDRAGLGGGTTTGCDGDGGRATDNFADTGVGLTYAQRDPGFVCRVGGAPASDPCVNTSPADAYWGLWWSDGTSGTWRYSSVGVGSLTVPAGGSVAFRFNDGDRTPPSVAPPVKAASSGSGGGTSGGGTTGGGGGTSSGSGSAGGGATPPRPAPSTPTATPSSSATAVTPTPTPTASAAPGAQDDRGDRRRAAPGGGLDRDRADRKTEPDDDRKDARDRRDTSPTPAAEPETEQETTLVDDPVDPQASQSAAADGLPVWVAPALVAGLLLVGGAVAGVRRFRGAPGRP
ncbi:hypothetical protein [Nocardioides sp. AX2bis]|uniref:hypothetical protein n=1 Tax=Nocardioides sp. AX2bis TaxID=2653157 RepID=UPI0012F401C5|nr:hypothetical protein [Nocardioides sp. AX2bis]VXB83961.1 conserved exported hypothetical protein [Nocardioides sp. AX2bis]